MWDELGLIQDNQAITTLGLWSVENKKKPKPKQTKMTPWSELTHMFSNQESIQEMDKKFKNSFLLLEYKNKKIIAKYLGYFDGKHRFKDKYGAEIFLNHETTTKVIIPIVKKGLYQCGKVMLFGQYTAYRQYRKSINGDSFISIDPMYSKCYDNDFIMYNYLNQHYTFDLQQAIDLLITEGKQSQVISPNFGIGYHCEEGSEPKFFLFYQDVLIGTLDTEQKVINIENEFFNQEVMDATRLINFGEFKVIYA